MTTLPGSCPGVVAHSSGNHAQAVARAAKVLGLPAVIVMPENAPALKRERTAADGARVVTVGNDSEERKTKALQIARDEGLQMVPPYDHPLIAAGQGTCAVELIEDLRVRGVTLDRFYAPISGGGLMAGCATAVAALSPTTQIIGVEPTDGDDTRQSLASGQRIAVAPPQTIADGLRVRTPGELTWPVIQRYVHRIETVGDQEMLEAMAWALFRLRVVVEPSGAASLAVALREGAGNHGVVLSGGNVATATLCMALEAGRSPQSKTV